MQRQESFLRPTTSSTGPQPAGTATTSRATIWERRDSLEDIAAQRGIPPVFFFSFSPLIKSTVLETIQGDSLSRENMEAYIDILRNAGALEE